MFILVKISPISKLVFRGGRNHSSKTSQRESLYGRNAAVLAIAANQQTHYTSAVELDVYEPVHVRPIELTCSRKAARGPRVLDIYFFLTTSTCIGTR